MLLVLDSHEYVFAFGILKKSACEILLDAILDTEGLKPADAFIAAYVEWTGAYALVTENRHFLNRHSTLPFKVLNAGGCLKLIKS